MRRARPLIIGHRGAPGYRPEHTASAFAVAIAEGADAIEVDVVPSSDGELVVRHENELSSTTDVAAHPEFAARRRAAVVDGRAQTGWFTEDFTWAELATLRARERLPRLRRASAVHDDEEGLLRLADVQRIAQDAGVRLVVEVKHPTHFASIGFGMAPLVADALRGADPEGFVVESFEKTVLRDIRDRGVAAPLVYLLDSRGIAPDLAAADGPTYRRELADLAPLAEFAGIGVPAAIARHALVEAASVLGLDTYAWTLRPENVFLPAGFRAGGGLAAFGRFGPYWRSVFGTGVAGVFADHPDLAIAACAESTWPVGGSDPAPSVVGGTP